jgi:hypothetical protein
MTRGTRGARPRQNAIINALPWWLDSTNSKKYLKIYKKYDHVTINKFMYIILTHRVVYKK